MHTVTSQDEHLNDHLLEGRAPLFNDHHHTSAHSPSPHPRINKPSLTPETSPEASSAEEEEEEERRRETHTGRGLEARREGEDRGGRAHIACRCFVSGVS